MFIYCAAFLLVRTTFASNHTASSRPTLRSHHTITFVQHPSRTSICRIILCWPHTVEFTTTIVCHYIKVLPLIHLGTRLLRKILRLRPRLLPNTPLLSSISKYLLWYPFPHALCLRTFTYSSSCPDHLHLWLSQRHRTIAHLLVLSNQASSSKITKRAVFFELFFPVLVIHLPLLCHLHRSNITINSSVLVPNRQCWRFESAERVLLHILAWDKL